jgi:hypothetical protein
MADAVETVMPPRLNRRRHRLWPLAVQKKIRSSARMRCAEVGSAVRTGVPVPVCPRNIYKGSTFARHAGADRIREGQEPTGTVLSPEVFPRADGTTYVCAISSEAPLPIDPAQVAPDPGAIERLEAMCASLSLALSSTKILGQAARRWHHRRCR